MLSAPAPDPDNTVGDGNVHQRRRDLTLVAVGAAVALVVTALIAVGVSGVLRSGGGTEADATTPARHETAPKPYPNNLGVGSRVPPGTYRVFVGVDSSGNAIDADLTIHVVWGEDNYPVFSDGRSHGAVAVYQPTALASGTGCLTDKTNLNIADTAPLLAQQLARLPQSTILQPPTPVQAFGGSAYHVRLRINPAACGAGIYRVAMTLRGGQGISFSNTPKPVVIDFWTLYVGGTTIVVDTWHETDASSQLVQQIARTRNSITFTPSD